MSDVVVRPETESYTYQTANLVRKSMPSADLNSNSRSKGKSLRVLDLCTGTGCMALLLHALLAPQFEHLHVLGIDISPTAMSLSRKNLDHNLQLGLLARRASTDISFHRADVLGQGNRSIPAVEEILPRYFPKTVTTENVPPEFEFDVLVSNPPYISSSDFRNGTTARSVRLFEPRIALVPPVSLDSGVEKGRSEDIFYRHILSLSRKARAKLTVLECGDIKQARRVVEMYNVMAVDNFQAEVWPSNESDLDYYGFHPQDGSRCVIIQRRADLA